jgi:hypothetical protein
VGEDGLHGARVLDGGEDAQLAATAGAGEDIEIEHAAHQGGPGPRAWGAGGAGASFALARMDVRGRAAGTDDVRAPVSMRGEKAVIHDEVDGTVPTRCRPLRNLLGDPHISCALHRHRRHSDKRFDTSSSAENLGRCVP